MTASTPNAYTLDYRVIRNITAPEDEAEGRRIYAGQAPANAVLGLEDNENVREYLVDAKGKQKHKPTLVHQAIRKTLRDIPEQFSILNGGMVIVAQEAEIDEKARKVRLRGASIINGSQTQGELRRYFEIIDPAIDFIPSLKFELIVTDDTNLVAEISIARNFQNDVRAISIAGRRGQLDELESAVQEGFPDAKLRKKETDLTVDDEYLDTEKLVQVIFALLPDDLLEQLGVDATSRTFTYSQKTRCLKLFQRLYDEQATYPEVYECCLDLAPVAWALYEAWKEHQGFQGTRLRSIDRDGGRIVDVPDGMVFPIIAAHSAFVRKTGAKWVIDKPEVLKDAELIETAKQAYIEIANHNPQTMGKSKACYSSLLRVTQIYARLAR